MSKSVTQQKPKLPKSLDEYTVGIVCALPREATAIQSAFDYTVRRKEKVQTPGDGNTYSFGALAGYHVVLAHPGDMGNIEATDVARNMQRSFKNIKLCLLVGICGIVPQIKVGNVMQEAILGDVIISTLVKKYDRGKDYPSGFEQTDMFRIASPELQRVFASLRTPAQMRSLREDLEDHLLELDEHEDMQECYYPGISLDHLYQANYAHEHRDQSCDKCNAQEHCKTAAEKSCDDLDCSKGRLILNRQRIQKVIDASGAFDDARRAADGAIRLKSLNGAARNAILPKVFLGIVASGDKVMKNGTMRDKVAKEQEIVAFEMEGAGVWNVFPTVVIKAGCDYADSHKNKIWQNWAAMTAAACAKAFLDNLQMGLEKNVKYGEETSPAETPLDHDPRQSDSGAQCWHGHEQWSYQQL